MGLTLCSVSGWAEPKHGASALVPDEASLTADLEAHIPKWMADAHVPGLSIVLINRAKVAWRRGFGVKDSGTKQPVDPNTMFEAASMSKPVFAYVVMKLCEKGVLGLDVPLTKYTPERFLEGDPRLDLITTRHVLSHTSGFQNWREESDEPLRIHFTPGERYLYSGEGYNYLQTVVTRLLGQPFETYMAAKLFEPFGMHSSGYLWSERFARRMARPHGKDGTPMENKKSTSAAVARYGSAGALLTTPSDYAKFMIEILVPKQSDAFRLNGEGPDEMLRPQVKIEGGQYPASWALGWQIFHNKGRDFFYHGGDNAGFHCCAVASREGRFGFIAMTNGRMEPRCSRASSRASPCNSF
jgi:CubicO group peptidase (beta-lactamase class C family)